MLHEFVQQVEETARSVTNEIHTAIPGTIVSFDSAKGTALVQPNGKYVTSDGILLDYPKIPEVPVVFPFCETEGIGMVFPVGKGDSCLLVVSEVELDEWLTGAEAEGSLRFDLTNAICIPGLMKHGGGIIEEACRETAVIIGNKKNKIKVNRNKINMVSGKTQVSLSETGVAITGSLTVEGNITSTNSVKAGNIDLKSHVHRSSEPGSNTGYPE